MKKDRAERKKNKKQQKQQEKEEKKMAKENKKAEKELKKLEAKAAKTKKQKGDKKIEPKKRGRKASEKAEGWKKGHAPGTEVSSRTVRDQPQDETFEGLELKPPVEVHQWWSQRAEERQEKKQGEGTEKWQGQPGGHIGFETGRNQEWGTGEWTGDCEGRGACAGWRNEGFEWQGVQKKPENSSKVKGKERWSQQPQESQQDPEQNQEGQEDWDKGKGRCQQETGC